MKPRFVIRLRERGPWFKIGGMTHATTQAGLEEPRARTREEIPEHFTWKLSDIYPDWETWEAGLKEFETKLAGYADLKGTLAQGGDGLLKAFKLDDDLGQLSYKLWYYAGLTYDQDQRDNAANARRQRVQILFEKPKRRGRGLRPRCWPSHWRQCADGWRRTRRCPCTGSRSSGCTTSRNTCWTRRGSTCSHSRDASRPRRTTPTRYCPPQTSNIPR